jgi:hypothetical protein
MKTIVRIVNGAPTEVEVANNYALKAGETFKVIEATKLIDVTANDGTVTTKEVPISYVLATGETDHVDIPNVARLYDWNDVPKTGERSDIVKYLKGCKDVKLTTVRFLSLTKATIVSDIKQYALNVGTPLRVYKAVRDAAGNIVDTVESTTTVVFITAMDVVRLVKDSGYPQLIPSVEANPLALNVLLQGGTVSLASVEYLPNDLFSNPFSNKEPETLVERPKINHFLYAAKLNEQNAKYVAQSIVKAYATKAVDDFMKSGIEQEDLEINLDSELSLG